MTSHANTPPTFFFEDFETTQGAWGVPPSRRVLPPDYDFFAIPAELRLEIYSNLLTTSDHITIQPAFPDSAAITEGDQLPEFNVRRLKPCQPLCPAILATNKQIFSEAIAILYSSNKFRFLDAIEFNSSPYHSIKHRDYTIHYPFVVPFLNQIGPRAQLIQQLMITLPQYDNARHKTWCAAIETIQSRCNALRVLEFVLSDIVLQNPEDWRIRRFLLGKRATNARRYITERFPDKEIRVHIKCPAARFRPVPAKLAGPSEALDASALWDYFQWAGDPDVYRHRWPWPGTTLRIPGWTWEFLEPDSPLFHQPHVESEFLESCFGWGSGTVWVDVNGSDDGDDA
ncbi:hypothetical protein OQA88_3438 [Cercophora sp. LCS_1]